jgi:hypothetical protein
MSGSINYEDRPDKNVEARYCTLCDKIRDPFGPCGCDEYHLRRERDEALAKLKTYENLNHVGPESEWFPTGYVAGLKAKLAASEQRHAGRGLAVQDLETKLAAAEAARDANDRWARATGMTSQDVWAERDAIAERLAWATGTRETCLHIFSDGIHCPDCRRCFWSARK